jgi:hypothetical protein
VDKGFQWRSKASVDVIAPGKAREGGTKCNDTF